MGNLPTQSLTPDSIPHIEPSYTATTLSNSNSYSSFDSVQGADTATHPVATENPCVHASHRSKPLPSLPSDPMNGEDSLQRAAANYASLAQDPPPDPSDLSSAVMQLGRDMERCVLPARPSLLPRGDSTKTVNGGRQPGSCDLYNSSSSNATTPAAGTISDPFELASVVPTIAENLERKVDLLSPCSLRGTSKPPIIGPTPSSLVLSPGSTSPGNTKHTDIDHSPRNSSRMSTQSTTSLRGLERIASPDSWRSLLPKDDPYFASEPIDVDSTGRKEQSNMNEDMQRPGFIRHGSGESSSGVSTREGSRRYSSASSQASIGSTLSLLPPNAVAPGRFEDWPVDSWRSLLPVPTHSLSSSGPSSPTNSHPPPPLTSRLNEGGEVHGTVPTLSKLITCDSARSRADGRRHASFSSFYKGDGNQDSQLWYHGQGTCQSDGALSETQNDRTNWKMLSENSAPPSSSSHQAHPATTRTREQERTGKLSLPCSPCSEHAEHQNDASPLGWSRTRRYTRTAMEDSEERETWPTSRNSRDLAFLARACGPETLLHLRSRSTQGDAPSVMHSSHGPELEGPLLPSMAHVITATPSSSIEGFRMTSPNDDTQRDHTKSLGTLTTTTTTATAQRSVGQSQSGAFVTTSSGASPSPHLPRTSRWRERHSDTDSLHAFPTPP